MIIWKILNALLFWRRLSPDYYAFAVQNWCSSEFQIHGLWPQYNNGSYPSWCTGPDYIPVTDPLLQNMSVTWNAQCNQTINQDFWKHEWLKHGTCTGFPEEQYFTQALVIWNQITADNSTWSCSQDEEACIVACFDLNFNQIDCQRKDK